jgi:hypothetical protein
MKGRASSHVAIAALIGVLVLLGAAFLALVGIDALEGRSNFQFFADSNTYHAAARGTLPQIENLGDTIGIAGNFLGPLVMLALAGENYYAVLVLNALLMFFSVRSIANSLKLESLRLLAVLLANPLTISSLLSVNKEIISLGFVALLLGACVRRSVLAMLLAMAVSLLVRWQLTAFLIVLLALVSGWNPLREWRASSVLVLLVVISITYIQLAAIFEPVRLNFELSAEDYEGSGAYQWLIGLQDRGYYWLIFPLKAAHLLFATGLRFDRLFNPTEIYNDIWQLLHSTMTLVLFVVLWRARRLRIGNDLIFISLVYLAVFALTPIYTPRYFYLVYVFWAIALVARTPHPAVFTSPHSRGRRKKVTRRMGMQTPPLPRLALKSAMNTPRLRPQKQ